MGKYADPMAAILTRLNLVLQQLFGFQNKDVFLLMLKRSCGHLNLCRHDVDKNNIKLVIASSVFAS